MVMLQRVKGATEAEKLSVNTDRRRPVGWGGVAEGSFLLVLVDGCIEAVC